MHFSQPFLSLIKNKDNKKAKLIIEKSNLHHVIDAHEATLLHYSVEYDNIEMVQYLVQKNCRMDIKNLNGMTPLIIALKGKHRAITQMLLDSGAIVGSLHAAVASSDVNIVKVLIELGADVEELDGKGATPLAHLYSTDNNQEKEKIEILQILLNFGITLTSCTSVGHFQIAHILSRGSCEAVGLLLKFIVNFNVKDEFGERTILHYLAMNFNQGIIEKLKFYIEKFDVNALDKCGMNPVHEAIKYGNVNMLEFFLDEGAEVDTIHREHGFTPLLFAFAYSKSGMEYQCDRCVDLLLQHDANPQMVLVNSENRRVTIVDVALKNKDSDRIKSVIAQLAIIEAKGVTIDRLIRSKIISHLPFNFYFKKCQRFLKRKIYGTVTVFKLLTADKKKMARYLNNDKLVVKLLCVSFKQILRIFYSYYRDFLERKFVKGLLYKTLKDKAVTVISKFSGYRFDSYVVENIIDFLSNKDLQQLYYM